MSQQHTVRNPFSGSFTLWEHLRAYLSGLLDRYRFPEEFVIVSTAILVGLGTGFAAVIFVWLLEQINQISHFSIERLGIVAGLLLPMGVAGFVVGTIVQRWASEVKGSGVPDVMEAVAVQSGRIRPRVVVAKLVASSLTIGTGGSAGREGPIVQVGSAWGSTVGQLLRFSDARVRTLVACGAAAGIAATFNAPIAGSIFAMEVILGSFTVRYFGAVVISSVTAGVISRIFLSSDPAFIVPAYPLHHLGELPIYVVLGGLAAVVAVLFTRMRFFAEDLFDTWHVSLPVKAALGMILTGLVGLLVPGRAVLGSGLELLGEAIAQNFQISLGMMAVLLVFKIVATVLTLGTGNSGGIFAPSLFVGAALGGMVGTVAHQFWPTVAVNPGAYAIVGMAAVFAGAARAPITAVLIVFEMSGDYHLILPLMLATVLATLIAELIFKESIYTLNLRRKGISLERGRDLDILQSVTVNEVMQHNVVTIPRDMTLVELSDRFARTHSHGYLVRNADGSLWGIVTVSDLDRAVADERPRKTTVDEIGVPREQLVVTTPDETIGQTLSLMGVRGLGRLPVVAPDAPNKLLGLIRREDIARAYNIALARRAELQHRTKRAQLRNIDDTEFVDLVLKPEDRAVGKTLQQISATLPQDCILISVRRQGKILIPHGNTTFQEGDDITAFVSCKDYGKLRHCLQQTPNPESGQATHAPTS